MARKNVNCSFGLYFFNQENLLAGLWEEWRIKVYKYIYSKYLKKIKNNLIGQVINFYSYADLRSLSERWNKAELEKKYSHINIFKSLLQ